MEGCGNHTGGAGADVWATKALREIGSAAIRALRHAGPRQDIRVDEIHGLHGDISRNWKWL